MGVIGRPHGVRGLVRVHSYTADPSSLPEYGPFVDDRGRRFSVRWRGEGVAELAELVDGKPVPVTDRTAAGKLVNLRLYAERDRLPPPAADEFYLADLIGLDVVDPDGEAMGKIKAVNDFGAGDLLEIAPEHGASWWLPFTRENVPQVDIAGRRLVAVRPTETQAEEEG